MSAIPAGYKQTEVGVIPEDWEIKILAEVAEIRTGVAKNANISVSNPIAVHYLRVANVQDGYLDLSNMSQLQVAQEDLKRYAVLPGDVLMNEGGDLDKLGRGAVWRGEFAPCIHQNHVFVVRCRGSLSPDFLNIWTTAAPARRYFLVAGKQTTNLASINKTALGELPVAIPAETEQRAIAAALSDVDALLTKLDQLIAKKRDLKQATMQQLLTGQTRLPGFSGTWEVKRLGDVCRITTGKKDVNEGNPAGQYPFFTCARANTYSDSYSFEGEAILIAGNGEVGNLNYYNGKFEAYQRTYVLQGFSTEVRYLWHQLSAYLALSLGIGAIGSSIPYIKMENLVWFEFQSPVDGIEQTAIATVLSDMDAEVAALEARRDKTRALKQGMMQELLTGRIRLV